MWVFAASSLTLQQSGGCRLASDNICMLNGALGMFHVFFFFTCITWFVGILVSRAGIEPTLPALEAQSLNHWTTREVTGKDSKLGAHRLSKNGAEQRRELPCMRLIH